MILLLDPGTTEPFQRVNAYSVNVKCALYRFAANVMP